MKNYRLTHASQADIASILTWSQEQFGEEARRRYASLIVTAIRDASSEASGVSPTPRPELGDGVFSWHLAASRTHAPGGLVRHPRHFLICRFDDDLLVIGRVLHDVMDLPQHIPPAGRWQ